MNRRGPIFAGILLGVAAGLLLASLAPVQTEAVTGRMLSEHGGAIRSIVLQYAAGSQFVLPVYRDFLRQQPANLTVYLVCPEREDLHEVISGVGDVNCKLVPVLTHHAMTAWSRDRWVALEGSKGRLMTLLAQPAEDGQQTWPERAGDGMVIDDLARFLGLRAKRSMLYFDGGDLLADDQRVFATCAVLLRNQRRLGRTEIAAALEREVHRPAVLMDEGPDHHAAMFMMAISGKRMLVADPSLAKTLFDANAATAAALDGGAAFDETMQRRFDSVADLARNQGYRVTRIPVVPAAKGSVYITYVNVIMDRRDDRDIVYMPIYAGQEPMNAAAVGIWRSLGYQVQPIDCTTVFDRGGTLHCLVNVLERDAP